MIRIGRGDKNRTRISGFGDRCTAIVLHPYALEYYYINNLNNHLFLFNIFDGH